MSEITSTDWPVPGPDEVLPGNVEPPPDSDLPVRQGDVLAGRYAVDRVLAAGGMGVVCLGRHVELEQPVAIKFLRRELSQNQSVVQRFLNEARAAASLRSEHVVRVMDVAEHESGRPYLVMEHLDGIDLGALVEREGAVDPARAVGYVLDVCTALAEAHAAGIVHRDIKPENLILCSVTGREVVKVVDFGLAKRIDAAQAKVVTDPSEGMGSPCYMSPEQIATPHAVDARTDVWSLGVVLYRLLSGVLPFDGDSVSEVCARVLNAEPRRLAELMPRLDPELDAIVKRCLAKNRDERFPSIEALADAVKHWRAAALAETQPTTVPPPAAVAPPEAPTPVPAPAAPRRSFIAPFTVSIATFVLFGAALGAYAGGGVSRIRELTDVSLADGPADDDRVNGLADHPQRSIEWSVPASGVYAPGPSPGQGQVAPPAERELKKKRHRSDSDDESEAARADDAPAPSGHDGADATLSPDEIARREKRYRRYLDRHGYTPIKEVLERIERSAEPAQSDPEPARAPGETGGSH